MIWIGIRRQRRVVARYPMSEKKYSSRSDKELWSTCDDPTRTYRGCRSESEYIWQRMSEGVICTKVET